jgi:hypothetical protein
MVGLSGEKVIALKYQPGITRQGRSIFGNLQCENVT